MAKGIEARRYGSAGIEWLLAGLFMFRLATYLLTDIGVGGDATAYVRNAVYIAETGLLPELSTQPIGYPLLLSLFVNESSDLPTQFLGRVQQGMDLAIIAALVLLSRSMLASLNKWLFLVVASIVILQPFTGQMASILYSEQVSTFCTFFGLICISLGVARSRSSSLFLGSLLLGIASCFRFDLMLLNALVLPGLLLLTARARNLGSAALCGALVIFLAVPASVVAFQYSSTNEIGLVKRAFYTQGYMAWLRTWPANRTEYVDFAHFASWKGGNVENYPDRAFASGEEKRKVAELLSEWNATGYSGEIDGEFAAIAKEKRRVSPFAYYVGNSLFRMIHYWITDEGGQVAVYLVPLSIEQPMSTAIVAAVVLVRVLLLVCFAAGLQQIVLRCFRDFQQLNKSFLQLLVFTSAIYVLGRTLELGAAGLVSWGGLMEIRYVLVAFPLLIVVSIDGARWFYARNVTDVSPRRP